jgi:hypothetical protein
VRLAFTLPEEKNACPEFPMLRLEQKATESAVVSPAGALGWLIATTRALFFLIGITQPAPQDESKIAIYFWSAVIAIGCVSALAVALVVRAVSML